MTGKLLLVDDDPLIHKMLNFAFKDESYTLVSHTRGDDAKNSIQKQSDDISAIILDWEMPGINGLDLLCWLKSEEKYRDIPVIMLTSHSRKEDIQQGIDAGAFYYVTKPFNKDLLLSFVRRAVYDFAQQRMLKKQLLESQNPFGNLVNGTFKIRTLDEAQRISVLIANASTKPDQALMICELLVNAIEHGNLGIGYREKTELIEAGQLMQEIMSRLNSPENMEKFVTIEMSRSNGNLKVYVKDEGDGFDFKRYLQFDESRIFDNHGRGIAMANSMLDIHYIGKGNEVEVLIPLN